MPTCRKCGTITISEQGVTTCPQCGEPYQVEPPLWELLAAYQESVRIAQDRRMMKILETAPRINLEKWR